MLRRSYRRLKDTLRDLRRAESVRPAPPTRNPESEAQPSSAALNGSQALITGAGRRVGRAVAIAMARDGAVVHAVDRDRQELSRLSEELGDRCRTYELDVSRIDELDDLWSALVANDVAIDHLVNNASYQVRPPVSFLDSTDEQWRQTFESNVFAPVHLSRLIARRLRDRCRSGSILFVGSVHQWITGGWPEYSASKSTLTMLVKELALELGPHGIRVNAIAPGWVAERDERHANSFDHAPLGGRAIPPEYVGRAAAHLASAHHSAFTTGAIVQLDAGLSLRSYRTPARGRRADPHVRYWVP